MPKPRAHVFVCTNLRDEANPKGSCAAKGSEALVERLKELREEKGLRGEVRITKTGCLGQCAQGVTVVVYPRGDWYRRVTLADAEELLDAAAAGRTLERLRFPDDELK